MALLLLSSLACSAKAGEAETEELQTMLLRNNCTACHMIDKRKYGPILIEVAEKYADQKGAEKKLAKKIRAGGTGVWGEEIMPPQPQVSPADALKIAKLVLALKQ
ncbi:MAG: c-type cytochrome [Betaproteobacteria bacterium]|nr:c-type cytochrome [Betaproteobacteria bacterium]